MLDSPYNDEDLVYADPEKRVIVGKVEFGKNGNAKPLQMPEVIRPPKEGDERRRGKPRKRFYPWGTYKTMRKLYKIDGEWWKPTGKLRWIWRWRNRRRNRFGIRNNHCLIALLLLLLETLAEQ